MTNNRVREDIRNRSVADMRRSNRRVAISGVPDPASGCQGLTSRCSVTPGECSSGGRSFAALIVRLMVGRSTPRCTYTRQGYAPAPQRACARTPRDAERSWVSETPINGFFGITTVHFVPAAFSGMCCRNSVARTRAFCFRSQFSHDAMDFVTAANRRLPAHGRDRQIRRATAPGAQSEGVAENSAVLVDARPQRFERERPHPRGRDSRRDATDLRDPGHATPRHRQAWSGSSLKLKTRTFRTVALKAVRSIPALGQHSSRAPQIYRLIALFESMNHGESRND